jgi:hypothetical protein
MTTDTPRAPVVVTRKDERCPASRSAWSLTVLTCRSLRVALRGPFYPLSPPLPPACGRDGPAPMRADGPSGQQEQPRWRHRHGNQRGQKPQNGRAANAGRGAAAQRRPAAPSRPFTPAPAWCWRSSVSRITVRRGGRTPRTRSMPPDSRDARSGSVPFFHAVRGKPFSGSAPASGKYPGMPPQFRSGEAHGYRQSSRMDPRL